MSTRVLLAQIRSAQSDMSGDAANDLIRDLEPLLAEHAARAAGRMPRGNFSFYLDEFKQVARIQAWECLARFEGETTEEFARYVSASVANALRDAVSAEKFGDKGVGRVAMHFFAKAVERADGDLDRAEQIVQTEMESGRGFSAERAKAARAAWQGTESLDYMPAGGQTWGDILTATEDDVSVDEGAAPTFTDRLIRFAADVLEGHTVLPTDEKGRHAVLGALAAARLGSVTVKDVDVLSEAVRVPADATERRTVTEAFAILAAATQAGHLSLSQAGDYSATSEKGNGVGARMVKRHGLVREVLAKLAKSQRIPMEMLYGFTDTHVETSKELAGLLGKSVSSVQKGLSTGRKRFAELYTELVTDDPAEREALLAAMRSRRTRNGR